MRRWSRRAGLATVGTLSLLGCGEQGGEARLRRLEERVGALERPAATPAPAPTSTADDLRSLERRLAALEQRLTPGMGGAAGIAAGASPTEVAEGRLAQRRERRTRLRELTDEYRARLTAIRQEETDPAARQQAVREALEWYRDQRRAILAGQPPLTP